jgi:hypothetical protein
MIVGQCMSKTQNVLSTLRAPSVLSGPLMVCNAAHLIRIYGYNIFSSYLRLRMIQYNSGHVCVRIVYGTYF